MQNLVPDWEYADGFTPPTQGQHGFDRVYERIKYIDADGNEVKEYKWLEHKTRTKTNAGRNVGAGTFEWQNGRKYKQCSPDWRDAKINEMVHSGDPEKAALGVKLENAIGDGNLYSELVITKDTLNGKTITEGLGDAASKTDSHKLAQFDQANVINLQP